MTASEQISDLMIRWESSRREGKHLTADELGAECPQFVEPLRQRIAAVLEMERILGVADHGQVTVLGASSENVEPALPKIPGFAILRILDHGGMGVVYLARELELGRIVALKMISAVQLSPGQLARFRVEAESAAHLQHPNCVPIFHFGAVDGRPYFSMEYIDGGSLSQPLDRTQPFTRRAAELVETLARAVQFAHEHGIVHRDLKPSNVLLTSAGVPKISDFGLAKRLDGASSATQTGEILGTPCYMAPEQAEGKKDSIGPLTDVYGLGAILYELLTGRPPFRGASPLETIRMVAAAEPIPPTRLAPSVPRDLEAICLKCLEKTPRRRYGSAGELADDLRRFLNGQPVHARRIGSVRKIWRWIRRHPQWSAALGMAAILTGLGLGVFLRNARAEHEVRARAVALAPQVREIFVRNCHECHGQNPRDVQKGLDILDHALLLDGKRKWVVPGLPGDSRIIKRIADGSMPPEEEEIRLPRLTEKELVILQDWIRGGAPPLPVESSAPPDEHRSSLAAEVKTIFHERCYGCHKFNVAKGGIKILHHRLLVDVRKAVVPFQPEESELYHVITSADDEIRMPKAAPPLTPAEIETIRQWIVEGALPFPRGD